MKICLIIPYFGILPDYFKFFLKSCAENPSYNWLIISNDNTHYEYPNNVDFIEMSFEGCKKIIQSKFDFEVSINRPHKLCDFKPAYGYIFQNYIENYDYWGYTDIDLIYGDLSKFYIDYIIKSYDKIGSLGHLTLFKNSKYINELFKSRINGAYSYKHAFSSDPYMGFDEWHGKIGNINKIFENQNLRILKNNYGLNFSSKHFNFKETGNFNTHSRKYDVRETNGIIATCEKNRIYKYEVVNNQIERTEYPYIHFHKRKINFPQWAINSDYLIVPNKIIPLDKNITPGLIKFYSKKPFIDKQYLKIRFNNLLTKIKFLLGVKLT